MIERRRKSEPRVKPSKARPLCSTSRKVIKQARARAQQAGEDPALAEHAAMIRKLGKRVVDDIIEIGRRLQKAKDLVGHGGWAAWLEREFDWSQDTASNFINVYMLSQQDPKFRTVRNLNLPLNALYLIARKSTPETVKNEIIERAKAGEAVTAKTVKDALESETEQTMASPTNDWRDDLRRGFREALKVANDAIRIGQQAHADISPELRLQMREALEPLRGQLPEVRKGGEALLDYFVLIENILTEGEPLVPAEAAE